jgi:bifunctional non-homologous end joining protein LigD
VPEGTHDPAAAVAAGELKFALDGQKLHGRFTLVRTSGRGAGDGEGDGKDEWLLIKKRDAYSVPGWDPEDHPRSVKSGRTNDEVREDRDAVWLGESPAAIAGLDLSAAREAPLPSFVPPMAATLASTPFSDPDWLFEIKWDGYRVEAVVMDGSVRAYTRNGNDAATYFPGLLEPPTWIGSREAIVDGEVVALAPDGSPSFELLQQRIGGSGEAVGAPLVYQVFDLLYLDGRSLLRVPLQTRKALLRSVLRDQPRVRYAGHVEEDGVAFYRVAAERGLEGVIAKHRRSVYEPGRRSPSWLKLKVRNEQEFVVGGFLPGEGNAKDLGALLVGHYEGGSLRYAGRVGSGFDAASRRSLRARLEELARDDAPFEPPPTPKADLRAARWAEPRLVVRVQFANWTRDDLIRQPSFKGLEPDRDPAHVVRERPTDTSAAEAPAESAAEPQAESAAEVRAESAAEAQAGWPAEAPAESAAEAPAESAAVSEPLDTTPASAVTAEELAALDGMRGEGLWHVGGRTLKLTNLEKVLFPPPDDESDETRETDRAPVTKRDLIRYFALVAPALLPHLRDRPLNLHRFPNGTSGKGFWQKDIPSTSPSWLRIWHETGVREDRGANDHLIADGVAALAWLANQAAFEIHAWTAPLADIAHPSFALIDIDPGERTAWEDTLTLARLYRTALGHLGVRGYPKLTGRRGIQVWVPVAAGRYTYAQTSAWVEAVSRAIGATVPELVSWEWSVRDRNGRARLDYTQNAPNKTLVAPYAVRPAAGAPVSAPIDWDELDAPDLRPDRWTIRTILPRIAMRGDLFAGALTDAQQLPPL